MKNTLLFLAAAALLFSACKKKEISKSECATVFYEDYAADTVFPSPYIMAYPGSGWNYDDGTTRTCNSWQQVGIVTSSMYNNCKTVLTTYTIVPATSFGYIHGENRLSFPYNQNTVLDQMVATTPGIFVDMGGNIGSGENAGVLSDERSAELLDSMTVLGITYYDVIHVHQDYSVYYYHVYSGPDEHKDYYYANGVGMIRSYEVSNGNTPVVRNLVSYTIGPH